MLTRQDAARELLRRRRARSSLLAFTSYTHRGWQSGPHHERICAALDRVEAGELKRLAIFAPPRHSKSELASRRFPAWLIGKDPRRHIIACSYNADLARDMGRDVRSIVRDTEAFCRIFPGVVLAADSTAADRWHTVQGGAYVSVGVGGTLTGRGADVIVLDDPIKNRQEADSQHQRDQMWAWYTSTLRTRLQPGGAMVLMVTRWHEDDLAGRALQSEQWEVVELPAISGEGTSDEQALWPGWFGLDTLRETRRVLSSSGRARDWSALYQQRPTAEDGTYMRREWFSRRWDERPARLAVYMASDFAVTSDRAARDPDYTEHGVFGLAPDGSLYVLDWWSGRETADVWIDALLDLIAKHKPRAWFGESGTIRRSVEPFLKRRQAERKVWCRQEWLAPQADKAARGRAFQAMSASGRVVMPASSEWARRIVEQCVGFPGAAHDDAFDALSLMCSAIDVAHPAVVDSSRPRKVRDYDDDGREARDWRVL